MSAKAALDRLTVVLQPIIDVSTGAIVAAEALARFPGRGGSTAEAALLEAYRTGRGAALEATCLRAALARRDDLPSGVLLSVNVSLGAATHPVVGRAVAAGGTGGGGACRSARAMVLL